MPGTGRHRSDDPADSGRSGGGRHRAEAPDCPHCGGLRAVVVNIESRMQTVVCPVCRGTGKV